MAERLFTEREEHSAAKRIDPYGPEADLDQRFGTTKRFIP